MALTAIETTRITAELTAAIKGSCPSLIATFLDGDDTEANEKGFIQTVIGTVCDNLFNQTPPTELP
jgi:hypothetical protein